MNSFGLKPAVVNLIQKIIKDSLIPGQTVKVWIFGSRAVGNHKKYSDVDLLIESSPTLSRQQVSKIQEAFEESSIPYKIDLVLIEKLYGPYAPVVLAQKKLLFE